MMELTNKNIEEYINRFLDGETTNAEEQAIYRFFCTGNVPAHLKEYAPMFAWYDLLFPTIHNRHPMYADILPSHFCR